MIKIGKIKEADLQDAFCKEFEKLVPEHLRPKLSVHHITFIVKAFMKALENVHNK